MHQRQHRRQSARFFVAQRPQLFISREQCIQMIQMDKVRLRVIHPQPLDDISLNRRREIVNRIRAIRQSKIDHTSSDRNNKSSQDYEHETQC